jgi:YD repeat-containing protein
MRKNRLTPLLLFSVLGTITSNAQQSTENSTSIDVNIKSPNVASMERFGNIPVSLFTGVPTISVPVYSISIGSHTLPIGISYHASGIQTDDVSSDVGVGWSLSAGFSISRVLRGKPDEHGFVGQNGASFIVKSNPDASTYVTQDSFKAAVNNIKDTEPDEFNFNIEGYSGKFIMHPDKIIIMPDQDLQIDRITTSGNYYFVITDPHGIKYYFNDASSSHFEGCGDFSGTWDYNSAWFVSKIIYPDIQDSLVFNYTTEQMLLTNFSQSVNYDYNQTAPDPPKFHSCQSYNTITEKKISSIVFPQGSVTFNYAVPKLEITTANSTPKAIDYISILDGQGALFRKVNFVYTYYNPTSSNNLYKKLKLDSVYSTSSTGLISNQYGFEYNGTDIAPYQSKSKDDWGYYNGANNTSLIPGNRFRISDAFGIYSYVPGGNRDVNVTFAMKGILNKISYPTGGNTQFEYEGNAAGNSCGSNVNDTIFTTVTKSASANCKGNQNPNVQSNTNNFTVPYDQTTQILVTTNQFNCTGDIRNYILKDVTTNTIISQGITNASNVQLLGGHNYSLQAMADCSAAEANMLDCEERITVSLSYMVSTNTVNKNRLAGGLRVKKITDYDPYTGNTNVKKYTYTMPNEPDRSSGIMTYSPKYDYVYHYLFSVVNNNGPGGTSQEIYNNVTSFCFTSSGNNTSQNEILGVAYQYVKETIGESGEGGSTLSTFSFPYRACNLGFPFAPQSSRYYQNGKLAVAQVYNASGVLQQQTNNYYSYVDNDNVMGWKVSITQMRAQNGPGGALGPNYYMWDDHYMGTRYYYYSQKARLDSVLVTDYFPSSSIAEKLSNFYLSNSSHYPYLTKRISSDGSVLTQTNWRSSDFSVAASTGANGATAAIKYMNANHLNDYQVESYSQINGMVTNAGITEYLINDLGTSKKILPSNTYKLNANIELSDYSALNRNISSDYSILPKDSRMDLESSCWKYTPNGSPYKITSFGNRVSSFLYGYKGRFPVAKIANIDTTAFTSYLSSNPGIISTLDNPSNDQSVRSAIQQLRVAFPNAFISAFTHNPLIGITSESDANNKTIYYEYDFMGRLTVVRDQDGNVIKSTSYQYQGPQF